LSGGNQQKVLLARVMAGAPRILFLDEPTRGIDIGAKEEIYCILRQLVSSGMSVILVSSELPEILALSDRVMILREGRAVATLANEDLTQERIITYAAGESHGSRVASVH
jgi:ABC-type sugar transport system ATPase subunit